MSKEQLVLLTVKELKAMAKENGLKGYSKLRKAELVEVLAVEVVKAEEVETKEVQEVQETKTAQILDAFFTSCLKFWQNEKDRGYTDTRSVAALALNDVRDIKNNPFSPKGKALDLAVKESWLAQKILNSYLKGDLTPTTDFTFVENEMLSSYEVMHDIEEMENVSIIFPANEEYKEVKEKYYNFRSSKTWHELTEMQEYELENLYDYNKPSEIYYNGTCYIVHDGMVVGGDEPKKSDCDQPRNKFLISVNNQIKIIVTTDYKILSDAFLTKMQKGLVELLGNDARCNTNFLKQRVSKLIKFKKDDWGNYDFSTENSHGTIKGTTVQFMNI